MKWIHLGSVNVPLDNTTHIFILFILTIYVIPPERKDVFKFRALKLLKKHLHELLNFNFFLNFRQPVHQLSSDVCTH